MPIIELAYVNIALNIFGFIVIAIIFSACLGEWLNHRSGTRSFIVLLAFVMIALIADSVNVVYVMCAASFFQIAAFVLFNAVSGTGAVKMTVLIESVTLFLYTVFVWLVIIRLRPSPAIAWVGEIQYQIVVLILCSLYLMSGKWKNKKL